jgi:hypothetical protein
MDVLRGHCAEVGRDYAEIEKTVTSTFDLGEDRQAGLAGLVDHFRELAAVGVGHVLASPRRAWDESILEAVASVLPDVHAIQPGT